MSDNDTKMTEPMSKEEMIDILKGLVFGTFDRTTAKERETLDMVIKALEQAPCEDCISKKVGIEGLTELINNLKGVQGDMGSAVNAARELIKSLPPVTPQPKTGRWISGHKETGALGITYTEKICSNCGWNHSLVIPKNYCPKCGAKMTESEKI